MSRIVTGSGLATGGLSLAIVAAVFFGVGAVGLGQGPAPVSPFQQGGGQSAGSLPAVAPTGGGAQGSIGPQATTGLITVTQSVGDKYQQLVVIDPVKRCVAVYHVELATGKIALKSTRNVHWDFELYAFNTEDPQPTEIRGMLNKQ